MIASVKIFTIVYFSSLQRIDNWFLSPTNRAAIQTIYGLFLSVFTILKLLNFGLLNFNWVVVQDLACNFMSTQQ